jgi:glucose-6-phosphate isomerase
MMEMMFLGALCQVNPFDQPNVEAYKRETRSILEK